MVKLNPFVCQIRRNNKLTRVKDVRCFIESLSGLIDKRWLVAYLLVHFGVVEHSDKLFEEGLASDLFVERCVAFVHEDVE